MLISFFNQEKKRSKKSNLKKEAIPNVKHEIVYEAIKIVVLQTRSRVLHSKKMPGKKNK